MKKILFLSSDISSGGGTERIAIGLANALADPNAEKPYEVHIYSLYGTNQPFFEPAANVRVSTLLKGYPPLPLVLPYVVAKLRTYLRKHHIDLVIGIGTMLSLVALPACTGLKTKHFAWEHFNFSLALGSRKERIARAMAAKFAAAIVVLTETDRQQFAAHMRCRAELLVIANFLTFRVAGVADVGRKRALAVGRLTKQKGFDTLINIWKSIAVEFPQWQLDIVGSGEDLEKLNNQIRTNNLEHSIKIIPATSAIADYYMQSALFLVSSRWEGLPMVMIEAQSFGLPMVSFDCLTGPRDIIIHDRNGLLIDDQNEEAFVKALRSLMNDPLRIERMHKAALTDSERFSAAAILTKWHVLLDKHLS